jgi:hypothetical protein
MATLAHSPHLELTQLRHRILHIRFEIPSRTARGFAYAGVQGPSVGIWRLRDRRGHKEASG